MYIKYWTNRLPVCPLHTLRLCYLLILENCILTTTIGITIIVISTSCGSLKLTSFVEYLCSHVHYNTFVLVLLFVVVLYVVRDSCIEIVLVYVYIYVE